MKKLLLVLAIGAFVASCNDGGTGEGTKDTTTTPAAPAPDSVTTTPDSLTAKPDSATAAAADTLKK
jgi:hypothetical protein